MSDDARDDLRDTVNEIRNEVKQGLHDVSASVERLTEERETMKNEYRAPTWNSFLSPLLLAIAVVASLFGASLWLQSQFNKLNLALNSREVDDKPTQLVLRPVQRQEKYTVRRPIRETVMKDEEYTVRRPVHETTMQEEEYTVKRPVYETEDRQEYRTVRKPIHRTAYHDEYVTVNEPVTTWRRELRTDWFGISQWVLVPQTTYVARTEVRKVPVQTVEYEDVIETRKVPVRTVRYVEETKTRKVPVETTRYVEETKTRKVPVEVTRYVEEERTRWVTDYVSSPVPAAAGGENAVPADTAPELPNGT